ncbi:NUDIX hydrolase [Paraburkholderia diazotrophica]|uniref:8-oxo-dGTP diphosphatase n=1 Tax=Paraburkholderia diazotrophica TaxID=667676 RepID=A0A1H7DUX5_9BURK|nr:NUDIX domain-containing protein [Paraburkholderia diazotrophica]SEK05556.1 8-oxo-dGTP diphosphatase [Paraburkholderia diazotrophica]
MKHRATVLCIRQDCLLLVAKRGGRWAIPGGRRKRDEVLSRAAARELCEETQLTAYRVDYLFQFWGAHTRHFVFAAQLSPGAEARPDNEIARCRWVKLRDVSRLPASIPTKAIVQYLLRSRSSLHRLQWIAEEYENDPLTEEPLEAHDASHDVSAPTV